MLGTVWETTRSFVVTQRLSLLGSRYSLTDGGGQGIGYVQASTLRVRDAVTIYGDETMTQSVVSFRADSMFHSSVRCEVTDPQGVALGDFRKDFKASLSRSTWHLRCAAGVFTGTERSRTFAFLRRMLDDMPNMYSFDFRDEEGRVAFSVEAKFALRDTYEVTIHHPTIDPRVVAAMAVALDFMQDR